MRETRFSFFTVAKVAILVFVVVSAFNFAYAAPQPTKGYVQYTVTLNPGLLAAPMIFTVNESAQPTSQNGFVAVTLSLSSNMMNFSYSKDVNSSSLPEVFPYLSGLTNQSFSSQASGISFAADLANTGSVPVVFNGASYQATNYQVSLSATNSTSGKSVSVSGNIVSMPSGLLESVKLSLNGLANLTGLSSLGNSSGLSGLGNLSGLSGLSGFGNLTGLSGLIGAFSVDVQLSSTSLTLTDPPSSVNPLGASLLVGAVIVAVALAVPAVFKKVRQSNSIKPAVTNQTKAMTQVGGEPENADGKKPSYWVD
jgi:hypothetical protein